MKPGIEDRVYCVDRFDNSYRIAHHHASDADAIADGCHDSPDIKVVRHHRYLQYYARVFQSPGQVVYRAVSSKRLHQSDYWVDSGLEPR